MVCRKPASCWPRRINKIIFVVAAPPEVSFDSAACGKPQTLPAILLNTLLLEKSYFYGQ
jgi:hypothetical protein